MGHSVQAFRGRLLTQDDRCLLALTALLRRLDRDRADPWLSGTVARWLRAVEVGGPGTIDLDLDAGLGGADLGGADAVDRLVDALRAIAREIRSYGERVPADVLNGAALPTGIVFHDFPSRDVIACIEALEALLRDPEAGDARA